MRHNIFFRNEDLKCTKIKDIHLGPYFDLILIQTSKL